jgi:hypothetical protein
MIYRGNLSVVPHSDLARVDPGQHRPTQFECAAAQLRDIRIHRLRGNDKRDVENM